jgi:hypothetical protein
MFALPNPRNILSEHELANVATMERTMWTDERLDERFDSIDRHFDELHTDIRELRSLMFQLWGTNMLGILVTIVAVIATRT